MGYRIKTVSDLTGIPKNTLVAWERRYGVLSPSRAPNGYRLYTDEDLAVLIQLKTALSEGLKISEAVHRVQQPRKEPAPKPQPALNDTSAFDILRRDLLETLERFDRNQAEALVTRLIGTPYELSIERVFLPLLRAVGERWERGDISVAQEHFASAFVRDQLTAMLLAVGCGGNDGMHVVCVTLPDERHELGALALAVHLALRGRRVTYLGADLPADDLAAFCRDHQPQLVCVSVIMPVTSATLEDYVSQLRTTVPPSTKIIIGGGGVPADAIPKPGSATYARDWRDAFDLRS